MQLLTNHLGYSVGANKLAVIKGIAGLSLGQASLVSSQSGEVVFSAEVKAQGQVDQWRDWYFYQVDFSNFNQTGQYYLQLEIDGRVQRSRVFSIATDLLLQKTLSDNLFYFKGQRCSGPFDSADKTVSFWGASSQTFDVHGGWYDASGDMSKYLSHLSYANFMNPQQTPMVVWNLLRSYRELAEKADINSVNLCKRLLDEALYGADYLVRAQHKSGYFFMTVFDKWSKDLNQREICAFSTQEGHKSDDWQAGFRQGGGIAIAALAACAKYAGHSDYSGKQYLTAARLGYHHLKENNKAYLNNGEENIIDEYCALLAATELYRATQEEMYLVEAREWATRLSSKQHSDGQVDNYWAADEQNNRPYFHAAEAGLPMLALTEYVAIETSSELKQEIFSVLVNAAQFELNITQDVINPFGYARQYIKAIDEAKRSAFFIPHNNESGYWWQGENARLGSLAAGAKAVAQLVAPSEPELASRLRDYAQQQLNWILGLNPFDACMLYGHGENNPEYVAGYPSAPGGICNGITSGFSNERDIDLVPDAQKDDFLQNWRWGEQWIPHAAWYMLAVALD